MSTTLEETVRQEQNDHDAAQDADVEADGAAHDTPEDPDGQQTIVDRSQYEREDLAINKVDGNPIDRISITFTGTIMLDRSEPADVALYNRLTLGKGGLTLMVEGTCSSTGAKQATNRDGELDVIVGTKGVKIQTVYIPLVENLDTELKRTAKAA